MKVYTAFLGLGSNIGERHTYLQRAISAMASMEGVRLVWTSSVYETDPVGKTDQPKFLNAVAEIETALPPDELLAQLKHLEQEVGRTATERWGPREIDIDILLYDGLVHESDDLTVPHPELPGRKFVLIPLREIAPDLIHPISGLTVTELCARCRDEAKVVKTSYRLLV